MFDFATSTIPEANATLTEVLKRTDVVDASITATAYDVTLVYQPVRNRMYSSSDIQIAIREMGMCHLKTVDTGKGTISVRFARSKPVYPGFHRLDDCDTRTQVVALFDGAKWWVPGSALAFPDSMVARADGTNRDGRFHHKGAVEMGTHSELWNVASGRFH